MTRRETDVSVLIATPQSMARELLMAALKRRANFKLVASAATAQEVIEAVKSVNVDVALISATLADGPLSGFGALRQIRECCPDVKSVMLLDGHEQSPVVDAFRAGAKGVFVPASVYFQVTMPVRGTGPGWAYMGKQQRAFRSYGSFLPTCAYAGSERGWNEAPDQAGRRGGPALGRGHAKQGDCPGAQAQRTYNQELSIPHFR